MLLHILGKVPRSRGCVWGACNAQAHLHASAYRVTTEDCGGGGRALANPSWPLERVGGLARKHARTLWPQRPSIPATGCAVTWAHHGAAGAGSRARMDRGVRELALPRDACGAGAAPPAWRSRLAAAAASG